MVEDHFQNLFKSEGNKNWGALLDCVPNGITEEMNRDLIALVSDEEIKAAVMNMGRLKAPGPDGFQGIFYQSFWEDLKSDINSLIRALMHEEIGPNSLNDTHVVLIPKVPKPELVSQFRPISLCNYSYKVLSKVLANRLKVVLANIISSSQHAFVEGRQIHDSIGIAHEMFHLLKGRKAKTKYELGLKIDMQKAYDRVEWDFLDATMGKMGFCNRWQQLIMGCVSSVQFAILLNGQPGKRFAPSRGLRQGDPLSPFLFLLVGEVFSRLIQKAVHDKLLDGVQLGASGPIISHILFADDTLLFLKADGKNCRNLVDLIKLYCDASGQLVNFQKSSVYFGANIPRRVSAELANILRVQVVLDPGAYMGVPAIWGRSKKMGLTYIKEKIMSKGDKRKTHWVSKEVLGLPKDLGGLGFRNFSDFNDALLAKQCWRLLSDPSSLWASVMKARYFLHCSFWDAVKGGRASWAWTSLLVGREALRDLAVSPNLRVSSLISHETMEWDLDFLVPFISEEAQVAIKCLPLGDFRCKDRLIWDASKNGKYSVKSGYRWLQMSSLASRDHRLPRTRNIPKKLWQMVPINPLLVLFGISSAIGSYWDARGWSGLGASRPSARCGLISHWSPPPSPFLKINVDASWSCSSLSGFVGVVVRDAFGQFKAAARYAISSPSVAVAEALALLRGCELGSSLGFQSVIMESDSRESIDWLSGVGDNGSWEAFPVLTRVKVVSAAFQSCRWSWVSRTANGAADCIASRVFPEMGSWVWIDRPPSSLVFVLNKDGLPCPP
ncbi:uncharacterized protein [Malus domestica]|uniref:uncharacterized protein n=1 Tax=Malus domestica TaxID=3750 RepID=UPI003974B78E